MRVHWMAIAAVLCGAVWSGAAAETLVAEGAELKAVATDLSFGEGPAWDGKGNLYFTDIPRSRIMKLDSEGNVSTFAEGSNASNGLYFDPDGNLYACEGSGRRITKRTPDGELTVVAERWEGKRFNQPNDLWIDPKGGIYFTDPVYMAVADREIEHTNVYYISPDYETVSLAAGEMTNPNGIIGTKDGKTLYITAHGDRETWIFDIADDGSLANKRLLTAWGSDGMTLDEHGNIYLTGGRHVQVFSPGGELLDTIETPEGTTNVTFGGPEGRTLFISCPKAVYAIEMRVRGH